VAVGGWTHLNTFQLFCGSSSHVIVCNVLITMMMNIAHGNVAKTTYQFALQLRASNCCHFTRFLDRSIGFTDFWNGCLFIIAPRIHGLISRVFSALSQTGTDWLFKPSSAVGTSAPSAVA